jgi:subtilisin family serine protease
MLRRLLHHRILHYQLVAAVAACLLAPLPAAACWTPLAWQQKPVLWNHDTNRDSIDDALVPVAAPGTAAPREDTRVDVVVDLTRCPEPADMALLSRFGQVLKRGRFITFVALGGVRLGDLPALAQNPLVAMIESMRGFGGSLDVSGAAIKVRDSVEYPLNLEAAFPGLEGQGTTVAIVDSGVDDQDGPGMTHESFPPGKWVGGYIAATASLGNADDTNGHGTHVAGIAVGTGGGSQTFRGVAPRAGLVECQTTVSCGPASELEVFECFEQLLINQASWGVDVVNVSLRQCDANGTTITQNGNDSVSQLANYLVSQGISVVAAAGNDGPANSGLTAPCSADNALCVAAVDDQGTVDRTGDQIAAFSSRGPRDGDGDTDTVDEMKPEISAPGVAVHSADRNSTAGYRNDSGTSMAAPHVAGAVALIKQLNPTINPGSLKDLLIRTAEDLGPAGWDPASGFGYLDLYAAADAAATAAQADPGYPGAGTYPESWLCSDVTTGAAPKVNVANTLHTTVRNNSATHAFNVRVTFGVYVYSAGTPQFYSVDAQTVPVIAPFSSVQVWVPWVPQPSSTGDPHACLKTTIDYGPDTNFANNLCERNISIDQTMSPVAFRFEVKNTLPVPARVVLETAPARRFGGALPGDDRYRLLPGERVYVPAHWSHELSDTAMDFGEEDCPEEVTLTLAPRAGVRPIEGALFGVAAHADFEGRERRQLGGVTALGHPPCPDAWGGDAEGDGVCDLFDNCDALVNPEQLDADGDGLGDLCDPQPEVSEAPPFQRCRNLLRTGADYSGFLCLDKLRRQLSKIWWSTQSEVLLSAKVQAAQTALCRRERPEALARLAALREFAALFAELGVLSADRGAEVDRAIVDCGTRIPDGSF